MNELLQKTKNLSPQNQNLVAKAYTKIQSFPVSLDHSINVALKLANFKMDTETIIAALLHELYENAKISKNEIEKEFGPQVAKMLDVVHKLNQLKFSTSSVSTEDPEKQIETLRKMFIALAEDIRVVLIKLVDRWHTLEDISKLPTKKQQEIAKETLEVYAPLAYRLGMGEIKGTLEDLAFPIAFPKEYQYLQELALPKYENRTLYIDEIRKILKEDLKNTNIKADIHGRAKHFYSLYKKLKKYDFDINKVYDLVALRIIVSEISDCYAVLGIIHKKWKPLVGRIKDYIAVPKPNGYQSLHTTVFCERGEIVEFQIRTKRMHHKAEYGVAAHWYYTEKVRPKEFKEGTIRTEKDMLIPKEELMWVSEMATWQKELKDSKEFLETLKLDVLKDRIFVFTPKGEVIDLPEGASPIDFAYHIHSDIGDHISGAKVNNKMVSLNYKLHNGDIVEILTQKNLKPSLDWLRLVKTARARERIRSWCKNKSKS